MLNLATQRETKNQISEDVFPAEAYQLIMKNRSNGDLTVLDVCTPKEFAELHLENAANLNFFSRAFKDQINALDRERTYLVYCKVGGRSNIAQKLMKKLGFREVYNIVGGTLLRAEEELPLASGLKREPGVSLCPVFNSIILVKKLNKYFQGGYRSLAEWWRQQACCKI